MSTYLITSLALDKIGISLGHAIVLPVDNHVGIEAFRSFNFCVSKLARAFVFATSRLDKSWSSSMSLERSYNSKTCCL
jgi:hypothetical protein